MPSTPTTKSQVQAYQFVLRRMQSALVRRDAVMLHDPMRTHTRATIVGVVLGALGMIAFIVVGFFSASPAVPDGGNIVISKESGAVYVVAGNPKTLVPTFNLASARLYLMALQNKGGGQPSGGGSAVQPTVISEEQLKDIPRGRLTGIVDAPQLLPNKDQRISDDWAICDKTIIDPTLPPQTAAEKATTETTVLAGVPKLGTELGTNEALMVTGDNGANYLIYRLPYNPNRPNANAVRAQIDPNKPSVTAALGLPKKGRHISMGMLNAIPEVEMLTPPDITGAGSTSSFNLGGLQTGDVFETSRGNQPVFYAILQNGIQEVSQATAAMIRAERSPSSRGQMPQESPENVSRVPQIRAEDPGALKVDNMPQSIPTVLDAGKGSPVSCLGWNIVNAGSANEDAHTAVYVSSDMPGPKEQNQMTDIRQQSPDGLKIDHFYLPHSRAAVVRSVTSKAAFTTGPISLISDRGLRYGVPDLATANGLGLDNPRPAPDAIIRLLPTGASLNTTDVRRNYDSVPVDPRAGEFPTQQPQAQGAQPGN